jgi:hypothetical protein
MTMRTRFKVECSCGHSGAILLSENDQPYTKPWESYSLENLNGGGSTYVEGHSDWKEVFQALSPVCPKCNATLSPG